MKEGKRGERMSGSNKIIFDQLTEDSVKLMDNGDYNVYHEVKETFQREAGKLFHNHTLFCIYFFSVIGNGLKGGHGS
jgi:hypothetical protein